MKGDIDSSDVSLDEDIDKYGPKKPKNHVPCSETNQFSKTVLNSEDSGEWMEKSNQKPKKHRHVKSKKKKSKKNKSKKDNRKHHKTNRHGERPKSKHGKNDITKKRKKRRRYTSSESSTSTLNYRTSSTDSSS